MSEKWVTQFRKTSSAHSSQITLPDPWSATCLRKSSDRENSYKIVYFNDNEARWTNDPNWFNDLNRIAGSGWTGEERAYYWHIIREAYGQQWISVGRCWCWWGCIWKAFSFLPFSFLLNLTWLLCQDIFSWNQRQYLLIVFAETHQGGELHLGILDENV